MTTTCPKCSYTRKPTDTAPDYECPSCGIIYAKFDAKADLENCLRLAMRTGNWSRVPPEHIPEAVRVKLQAQEALLRQQAAEQQQKQASQANGQQPNSARPTLVKCEICGSEISPKADACPKCGHPNKKEKQLSGGQVIGYLALAGVMLWYFAGGGIVGQGTRGMQEIKDQVAIDSVNQYQIAKRQGDPMQICVQAGFVSAAYLQAKDEANYQQWKKTESDDCEAVGIHR